MWPLLVVLLSQTPEPPAARAEARRLFVQGEKEFASGAVAAAESSFRQSFSLLPPMISGKCANTGCSHPSAR